MMELWAMGKGYLDQIDDSKDVPSDPYGAEYYRKNLIIFLATF